MNFGIVTAIEASTATGEIMSCDGAVYPFAYRRGQNVASSATTPVPQLSGYHAQPQGFQLKLPRVGDPILFRESPDGVVSAWGYARHFIELAERRFGTEFTS
jgi:hypothetical protein